MVAPSDVAVTLEKLRLDILPGPTKAAFLRCLALPFLAEGGWYLAGGTALALQAGHRVSVDLDFFTTAKTSDLAQLAEHFTPSEQWKTSSLDAGTLYGEFLGAKISLILYPSFTPAEPLLQVGAVRVLRPPDIAAMKILAISQRGRKRDFVDLYWLARNSLSLSQAIERASHQYSVRQNPAHILKSLVYFADAEDDPDPTIFFPANWAEVKEFFKREVAAITAKTVGLSS